MARILLVDDDDLSRSILRDLLGGFGYQVVEAADSVEGLKCFQRFEVDLVISDLFMPQHGGLEFIRNIRALDPDMGIIAVSGIQLDDKKVIFDQALQAGAAYALEKPFRPKVLQQAVETLLGDANSG